MKLFICDTVGEIEDYFLFSSSFLLGLGCHIELKFKSEDIYLFNYLYELADIRKFDANFTVDKTKFTLYRGIITNFTVRYNEPRHCEVNIIFDYYKKEEVRFIPEQLEFAF
jgi:hypothetical protein